MMPIRVRDLPSTNLFSSTTTAGGTTKSIFQSHFPINKLRFKPMSTTQTNNNTQQNVSETNSSSLTVNNGKQNEKPPPPPPPPEKPEPGDCCGSGCVRCVWDVYYEELEEYNKLYKST